MILARPIAVTALAVVLASSTAAVPASADPYTISDISPAPAAAFRISDVGAAPTPGYSAIDSDETPVAPEDLFRISDVSPR